MGSFRRSVAVWMAPGKIEKRIWSDDRVKTTKRKGSRRLLQLTAVVVAVVALAGLAVFLFRSVSAGSDAPALPAFVLDRPEPVRIAYAYAIAHPEVLTRIPCYCGCVNVGHHSNHDCFIRARMPDGRIVFDNHASG